jgi:hypothetical protein
MSPTLCHVVLVAATAFTGTAMMGCSTAPAAPALDGAVAFGALGPAAPEQTATEHVFFLGAGDAIGREVFTHYVASLEAADAYATGSSDFPGRD